MSTKLVHYGKLILAATLTALSVACTYTVFEQAVSHSINLLWKEWLDTDSSRWLITPLIFGFTGIFFWLLHVLDGRNESKESRGLGDMPAPTMTNFGKVLLIGYISLLAGASLGPEAILVPACTLLGAYFGSRIFSSSKPDVALIAGMGIIALFTAFFGSYLIGILTILLVSKQTKAKITPLLVMLGAGTALLTYCVLGVIDSKPAVTLPAYDRHITAPTIVWSLVLVAAGYGTVRLLSVLYDKFRQLYAYILTQTWWAHALTAASGLTLLYLIGGPLVQFTGNDSIVPLFDQATTIGALGIVWVIIVKVTAIAWSKAIGYHGGIIFPTIFLAAGCVILLQFFIPNFNAIYGLIATLVGAFIANSKTGILA